MSICLKCLASTSGRCPEHSVTFCPGGRPFTAQEGRSTSSLWQSIFDEFKEEIERYMLEIFLQPISFTQVNRLAMLAATVAERCAAQSAVGSGSSSMDANISIKTSPPDPDKYRVGEIYPIEFGNHLVMARCIATDEQGLFHFEELIDLPAQAAR